MHSERPYWLQQMAPILETLNEGVVIADDSDRIFFANTAFEEMSGIPRDGIIGRDALRLILSAEDYTRIQAFREKNRGRGRGREEFFLPTKDGGRLPVVISVRAMSRPEGGDVGIVTLTDISEQKRTEEKLREANARLEEHQREIELDLTLAAGVQQSLAPKAMSWGSLQVDTFYQPWHRIGGDFGLVSPLDDEHLNIVVGDVSGHGISAALVANRIYSETLTLLGHRAPLADVLRQLNSLGIPQVGGSGSFFTLAAARVNRDGRGMEFAGAGHPPAMIVQPGAEPRLLPSRSMILGTLPDAVDSDATVCAELQSGDRIILYTDGITEVFDSDGEMLEIDGLQNFVRETAILPFSEMKQGILDRVAAWRVGPPLDDVSLVLVEVN